MPTAAPVNSRGLHFVAVRRSATRARAWKRASTKVHLNGGRTRAVGGYGRAALLPTVISIPFRTLASSRGQVGGAACGSAQLEIKRIELLTMARQDGLAIQHRPAIGAIEIAGFVDDLKLGSGRDKDVRIRNLVHTSDLNLFR